MCTYCDRNSWYMYGHWVTYCKTDSCYMYGLLTVRLALGICMGGVYMYQWCVLRLTLGTCMGSGYMYVWWFTYCKTDFCYMYGW